jgi:hypothetical protein
MATSEKVVSPGVFTNEIDQSFLPAAIGEIGGAVIGPTVKGPAMIPTVVSSMNEFVQIFGETFNSGGGDFTYLTSETARQYLKHGNKLTVVRILDGNFTPATANVMTGSGAEYTGSSDIGFIDSTAENISFKLHTHNQGEILNNKDVTSGDEVAATAALSCVDGDLNTENQFTEGEFVEIISTDGTKRIYVLCDGSESTSVATGDVIVAATDIGNAALGTTVGDRGTCIAVLNNLNTHNQATVLNEIRTAILSANGHNGKIACSAALTPADGAQTITLTQAITGPSGNQTSTVTTNPQITCANFTGGVADPTGQDGLLISGSVDNIRWQVTNSNHKKGTFNLLVRAGNDTHRQKQILETWNNLSIDPNANNYVAKVIGDSKPVLSSPGSEPYIAVSGSYPNKSKYVRVEVLKSVPDYLDVNGNISVSGSVEKSMPGNGSGSMGGAFTSGSSGYVGFDAFGNQQGGSGQVLLNENISNTNTQGYKPNTASEGKTAYEDAISLLSNSDEYDINLLFLPGIIDNFATHQPIVTKAINACEDRADLFIVVDPTAWTDNPTSAQTRAEARNSNYAAMYYPWVQIGSSALGRPVWVPPSVAVSGVYTFNDKVSHEWFAPAGLNRGTIDSAVKTQRQLLRTQRDELYNSNVNPIAQFPGQGVVVYGQKTLQKKASALDRVNVRRLLIKIKKFIASTSRFLVFEQNNALTRNRFLNIVNPYLEQVQSNSGLNVFKVVMDDTNNTPDIVDRNQLYGQIFIQPTRTAEFIVIDFNVMRSGAAFPE